MFWHGKQMYRRLSDEVLSAGLAAGDADPRPVTDEDIAGLPSTVRRYLRAMGVVHCPHDWAFLAHFTGRFRLKGQGALDARRGLAVSFTDVDDRSFDVTLADHGQTVTARVFLDDHGYPINFSTTDRYADLPGGLVQAEWTTPIDGWKTDADRLVFTRGRAIWQLPDGPLDYLEFRTSPGAIRYNLTPGDITTAPPQP